LTSAARATPPLAAYGQLPSIQDIAISPDGSHLAMMIADGPTLQVQIRDAVTHKLIALAPAEKHKIRDIEWAGDHHLLVVTSTTATFVGIGDKAHEYLFVQDYDLRRNRWYNLLEGEPGVISGVFGDPMVRRINGRDMVFLTAGYSQYGLGVLALYGVDLDYHQTAKLMVGDDNAYDFMVDTNGQADATVDYDEKSGKWSLRVRENGHWTPAMSTTALLDPPELKGRGPDGHSLLIRQVEEDGPVTKTLSLTNGAMTTTDIPPNAGILEDPRSEAMIGSVVTDNTKSVYSFLAPSDQQAWEKVLRAFPNAEVTLDSWSDDRLKIVVHVVGQDFGDSFFLVDLTTKRAAYIGDEYDAISPDDLAEVRFMHYAAADGLSIPAYLTLPQGRPAKGLPLIVLVHGGPAARDEPGFDWWSQALASRGYAVLQPQYRGSFGFGTAFLEAGYGQWGKKMQTDVSDGVRALAKSGVIDPARVCIVGASYGGYAALAAAAFDPSAYRCAASLAGPADLKGMINESRDWVGSARTLGVRYWDRFMGAKSPTDAYLDEISPAKHADKITMPILLIHGLDDTVVPYSQSQTMAAALGRAGKPATFVTLKDEDHWLSRSETRLEMLKAMVQFLETNNPPDPAPAPPPAKP
jgi:dipeptidyl aminopeptidase/acylaminoacyl peptidase